MLDAGPNAVDPELALTDLGVDSLMAVEIQTAVEDDLDLHMDLVEMLERVTLRQLAESLREELGRHPSLEATP